MSFRASFRPFTDPAKACKGPIELLMPLSDLKGLIKALKGLIETLKVLIEACKSLIKSLEGCMKAFMSTKHGP